MPTWATISPPTGPKDQRKKDQRQSNKMGIIYLQNVNSTWSNSTPQSEQGKCCAESDWNDGAATTKPAPQDDRRIIRSSCRCACGNALLPDAQFCRMCGVERPGGTSHSENSLICMKQSRNACQSLGSAEHDAGNCQPCAWFWKQSGCCKDSSCSFCHMCPDGEVKRRRQKNRVLTTRRTQKSSEAGPTPERQLPAAVTATESTNSCHCGNILMVDAIFCRECGRRRGEGIEEHTSIHTIGGVFQLLLEKALPPAQKPSGAFGPPLRGSF